MDWELYGPQGRRLHYLVPATTSYYHPSRVAIKEKRRQKLSACPAVVRRLWVGVLVKAFPPPSRLYW